jgi:uncharacterized protein (UPF0548 family)
MSRRTVHRLRPFEADLLPEQDLTYAPVGATRTGTFPRGFHQVRVRTVVGHGDEAFEHAAETVLTWRMHAAAGLRVAASDARVAEGSVVRCRLGPLRIPCRVLWVLDERDARGFGYGTLPGHPESGEEAFVVTRDHGEVSLTVSAYSRPGLLVTRLAGPVGRWGQRGMIARYARAVSH